MTSPSARTVIREYLDAFIVAGLVALFLITFVVRTFFIPSGSMIPTLQIHDVLLVNEFEYRFSKPAREDIVVFPPPISSPNDFIKRLIGAPGDTLRIHNGIVYRNGVGARSNPTKRKSPTTNCRSATTTSTSTARRSIRRSRTSRRRQTGARRTAFRTAATS